MKRTQCERLLSYLRDHDGVDPLTAWQDLGIYRLGARTFDLRRQGHAIRNTSRTVLNRFGERCRVAWYVLEKGVANG